jgi:hypothetical protein
MNQPKTNFLPQEILKACLMLGIKPEDLSEENVRTAWKRQVSQMAKIGDLESATHLRSNKNALISWLRDKRLWFNPSRADQVNHLNCGRRPDFPDWPNSSSDVPRHPWPTPGSGNVALPKPDLNYLQSSANLLNLAFRECYVPSHSC